jgi:hypothetical protein
MARSEATVEELVGKIERGELRLPEMQRRYVWRKTRVRDLLDSLYRGYPSGAILLWETDELVPEQSFAVGQAKSPYSNPQLLLDGQQRLTSLSAVIRGVPVTVRGHKRPIELLFNLDHPDRLEVVTEVDDESREDEDAEEEDEDGEEDDSSEDELARRFERMTFVVATKKLEQQRHWVRVSDVFRSDSDAPFLERAGVERVSDPRFTRYSERLARLRGIRKYVYRMDVLERSLSYDEVTEIFVRVNSLGAKLRSSDLALAQITARWRGALAEFQTFQESCAKQGFALDLSIHLKNLIAFATGQSRFLTVGSLSLPALQDAWKRCKPAMQFALNFLRSNVGIETPALLSSPFIIVTLAYYGDQRKCQLRPSESDELRRWVLIANAKARYSRGSSETLIDRDLTVIKQGGTPAALIEELRKQVGRLDIDPAELEGRNQRSALFKSMFLAFRKADARDWNSSLLIALQHVGNQDKLQFHHIFPKATLRKSHTVREADDIANLAFIGGRTNRKLSDRLPSQYLPELARQRGGAILTAQCIPMEPGLLELDGYKLFLAERRRLVAARLNEFLETERT